MKYKIIVYSILQWFLFLGIPTYAAFPTQARTESTANEQFSSTNEDAQAYESISYKSVEKKSTTKAEKKGWWNKIKSALKDDNQVVGALLCFFLGYFGIHSFYYGNNKQGFLHLALSALGLILFLFLLLNGTSIAVISTLFILASSVLFISGIWVIYDLIRIIMNSYPTKNFSINKVNKDIWNKIKTAMQNKKQIKGALLSLFVGLFGIHSFYFCNKKQGIVHLGLSLLSLIFIIIGASVFPLFTIFLFLGAIIFWTNVLWVLYDLIRILMGSYPNDFIL